MKDIPVDNIGSGIKFNSSNISFGSRIGKQNLQSSFPHFFIYIKIYCKLLLNLSYY
jgi:hypothetical protein